MDYGPAWRSPWACEFWCSFSIAITGQSRDYFFKGRGNWILVTDILVRIMAIEAYFLYTTDWERSVEDAKRRNTHS